MTIAPSGSCVLWMMKRFVFLYFVPFLSGTVLIFVDLRVRFGYCSSSPLVRVCGLSFCALHCKLLVSRPWLPLGRCWLFVRSIASCLSWPCLPMWREDLRVRFGDCSSSPLVRFRGLLLAVGVPRCGRPVVRDIPSGFVATSALEIEVSSRYFLFLVLPPFFVSVMPDRYSHCVLTPIISDTV